MKLNEVCAGCGLKCTKDLKTGTNSRGTALYADPCMGILPGVKFSCCGHGRSEGYFAFENGVIVRFETTIVEKQTFSIHHKYNSETTTRKTNYGINRK